MTSAEMNPEQAYEEALRRIEANRASQASVLDLGDLPLEDIPGEVSRLGDTLEVLALGWDKPVREDAEWKWEHVPGREPKLLYPATLSKLAELTRLRAINLGGCAIAGDLRWLLPFNRLESLSVRPSGPQDLSPLGQLVNLRDLEIGRITAGDLRPLSKLIELRSLAISGDGLRDLGPLSTLTQLQALSVDGGDVSDYRPLAQLRQLRSLGLRSDRQKDLGPLANLTELRSLDVTDGQVSDLRPLSRLANLRDLSFCWCAALKDLRPLAGLLQLQRLTLRNCGTIVDLRPLSGLAHLRRLDLTECESVSNVAPLSDLSELELLILGDTSVTDTSALSRLPKLRITFGAPS